METVMILMKVMGLATLMFASLFWGVWHLPILISGMYMLPTMRLIRRFSDR